MNWRTRIAGWMGIKASSLDLLLDLYGGRSVKSGVAVNWKTALDVTTMLGCCRVLGEGVAQVPFQLMQTSGNKRLPAVDHPLYDVLFRRPNPWMTSFEFREMMVWHAALTGNAFAFVNRIVGKVRELIPFEPHCVTVKRSTDGTLAYDVTLPGGGKKEFPAEAIWHLRGPSWNGWLGLETVYLAREAIGLALATEETHAMLHAHGVQSTGVLSVDQKLDRQQYEDLRAWVDKYYAGNENVGRPLIVDRAAKWTSTAITGVDSQHIETRRFQIEEICRAMRVLPIMVMHSDKASTYASAEQMFLAHLVHTLSPWYERIEHSADVNLLTDKERAAGYYTDFCEESLLRASLKDTKDYLLGLVNGGLMTPNEGREMLDLNPDADPESDQLRIPANITGAADATATPDATPQGA